MMKDFVESIRGLIYIGSYLTFTTLKNRRFPMSWMKWRVETYYGIPASDFTWRLLFKTAKFSDLMKYAKWVQENRKYLKGNSL